MKFSTLISAKLGLCAALTFGWLALDASPAVAAACTVNVPGSPANNLQILVPPCDYRNTNAITFSNVVINSGGDLAGGIYDGHTVNITLNTLELFFMRSPNPTVYLNATFTDLTDPFQSATHDGLDSYDLTFGGGAGLFSFTSANQTVGVPPQTGLQTDQPAISYTVPTLNIGDFLTLAAPGSGTANSTSTSGHGPYTINSSFSVLFSGSFGGDPVAADSAMNFNLELFQPDAHLQQLINDEFPPIPEPATLALFGAGLAGIGALRRRRK